jgi:hypothetical protein
MYVEIERTESYKTTIGGEQTVPKFAVNIINVTSSQRSNTETSLRGACGIAEKWLVTVGLAIIVSVKSLRAKAGTPRIVV